MCGQNRPMHLPGGSTFNILGEERDRFRTTLSVLGRNLSLKTEAGIPCAATGSTWGWLLLPYRAQLLHQRRNSSGTFWCGRFNDTHYVKVSCTHGIPCVVFISLPLIHLDAGFTADSHLWSIAALWYATSAQARLGLRNSTCYAQISTNWILTPNKHVIVVCCCWFRTTSLNLCLKYKLMC